MAGALTDQLCQFSLRVGAVRVRVFQMEQDSFHAFLEPKLPVAHFRLNFATEVHSGYEGHECGAAQRHTDDAGCIAVFESRLWIERFERDDPLGQCAGGNRADAGHRGKIDKIHLFGKFLQTFIALISHFQNEIAPETVGQY